MPYIDQVVLGLLLTGLVGSGVDHRRRSQRGWRLAALTVVSFYGVGLVVLLAAHSADIIYNTVLANRSPIDGSRFTYNWRTYSLLLFGALLAFFGTIISVWSSLALIVAAIGLRLRRPHDDHALAALSVEAIT
jgi:hypothetical protein